MSNYGIDSMMYTAQAPWQGIGHSLEGAVTWEEAIEKAGLNWQVAMKPIFIERHLTSPLGGINGSPVVSYHKVPNRFACTRRDTGDVFGVFGKGYQPLSGEDLGKFPAALVAAGEAVFHSGGSLNGGARRWLYLQLPSTLQVSNTAGRGGIVPDVLDRGILVTDSLDGSSALGVRFMTVRQRCCNTIQGIVGGRRGFQFKGRHTINLMGRVNEAREILGLEEAYSQMLQLGIDRLAQEAMDKTQLNEFLVQLFGQEEDPEAIGARIQNQMDRVGDLFYNGMGNVGETRWDALNAVTEFVDHHRGPDDQSKRLNAAWFGGGADMKAKAWELLVPAGAVS